MRGRADRVVDLGVWWRETTDELEASVRKDLAAPQIPAPLPPMAAPDGPLPTPPAKLVNEAPKTPDVITVPTPPISGPLPAPPAGAIPKTTPGTPLSKGVDGIEAPPPTDGLVRPTASPVTLARATLSREGDSREARIAFSNSAWRTGLVM